MGVDVAQPKRADRRPDHAGVPVDELLGRLRRITVQSRMYQLARAGAGSAFSRHDAQLPGVGALWMGSTLGRSDASRIRTRPQPPRTAVGCTLGDRAGHPRGFVLAPRD